MADVGDPHCHGVGAAAPEALRRIRVQLRILGPLRQVERGAGKWAGGGAGRRGGAWSSGGGEGRRGGDYGVGDVKEGVICLVSLLFNCSPCADAKSQRLFD